MGEINKQEIKEKWIKAHQESLIDSFLDDRVKYGLLKLKRMLLDRTIDIHKEFEEYCNYKFVEYFYEHYESK